LCKMFSHHNREFSAVTGWQNLSFPWLFSASWVRTAVLITRQTQLIAGWHGSCEWHSAGSRLRMTCHCHLDSFQVEVCHSQFGEQSCELWLPHTNYNCFRNCSRVTFCSALTSQLTEQCVLSDEAVSHVLG
jgi:hypothetical protein